MSFRAKSRNLRILITFAVKSVPRSFDSPSATLRVAQDDSCFGGHLPYMLMKSDNHNYGFRFGWGVPDLLYGKVEKTDVFCFLESQSETLRFRLFFGNNQQVVWRTV